MENIFLSKTSYCKSLQCEKIIWLKNYRPKEAVQQADQRIFDEGHRVGRLAQNLFGEEHDDVRFNYRDNYRHMLEETQKFLEKKPNIITEATFSYENNFCMVDILKNDEDGVEIYEVKSSTKVTDIYLDDASFQYYVLSNLGFNVRKVCIVYINNQYVREEKLDLSKLFNIEDITETAIQKQEEIRKKIEDINKYMQEHDRKHEPHKSMDNQCLKPYPCDFIPYCSMKLENINFKAKSDMNIALTTKSQVMDIDEVKKVMDSLAYPLHFIDYETYMTPIPEIVGTRPYQQLPFQYSLHILKDEKAEPEHKEFLADPCDENFIRHLAEDMLGNISQKGSVIVYNQSFEEGKVNDELIRMFPDLAEEITEINTRMVDFMEPFRKQYYTNNRRGSYSIKEVLPLLCPNNSELDYDKFSLVHRGDEASDAFIKLKNQPSPEREKTRNALLEYCKLDTYAMVKIYEKFREVLNK